MILDPVPNRVGLMPARAEFLDAMREVTAAHGILLIFDEVISFRVGYRGAQGAFGVRPDLTTFGKIIGGGFPVGAVGGRADVMAVFDPRGGKPAVPHGGTFNANPVTMAAGLAAMRLMDEAAYARLDEMGETLAERFPGLPGARGRAGCHHRDGLALSHSPHATAPSSTTGARWPMTRRRSASTSSTARSSTTAC